VGRTHSPVSSVTSALPSVSPAPSLSSSAVATPATLRDLARQLDGRLIRRGEAAYSSARLGYNALYDGHRPAAIATCDSVEDVQRCLEMASTSRIPVAARSGGHSFAGYSTPSKGLIIDLSRLAAIRANTDGTVRIGAGARLADVYAALGRIGRCLPGGSCPTVGIGGLTLGGGVGYLTRAYGLTCDRLVAADVVTPDGVLRHVSATAEPDLFWALRGGGGGNFGVVTSFTFRTAPAPPAVTFFLQFEFTAATEVLGAWQNWIQTRPDELTAGCTINSPERCVVSGLFLGRESTLSGHLDDLVRQAGVAPTAREIVATRVAEAMYGFAGCSGLSAAQCSPDWTVGSTGVLGRETFAATSRILYHPTDPAAVIEAIHGANVALLLDPIGGAAGRVAADATAFPHRNALATVQLYTGGQDRGLINALRDRLGQLVGQWGYVNYIDPAMPQWAHAYYAANLPRLQATARKYDPDHVLAFAQNVA
jgi:FAD/FMN-containing dehydrogenase